MWCIISPNDSALPGTTCSSNCSRVSFPHLYDFLFIITKHGEWEPYQKFPARFSIRLQPSHCPVLCIPHLYYHTHFLLPSCISHFPSDTITCTSSWHSPKDATQTCHWGMKPSSKSKISSCYENSFCSLRPQTDSMYNPPFIPCFVCSFI